MFSVTQLSHHHILYDVPVASIDTSGKAGSRVPGFQGLASRSCQACAMLTLYSFFLRRRAAKAPAMSLYA